MATALDYLRRTQHPEGSWYGRWGMNYIYGTWSVLCALNTAGVDHQAREVRKGVDWLVKIQNSDGGWGEDGSSYKLDYKGYEPAPSTPAQTAWALLGLHSAGDRSGAAGRGLDWLARNQLPDGSWDEPEFTGTGFPGDFYINYHLYRLVFPLMALGRWERATWP